MLVEMLRTKLTEAIKSKDEFAKNVLRTVIGESERSLVRSDENVLKVIHKLIEGNTEFRTKLKETGREADPKYVVLGRENEYMTSFLPRTMNVEEIVAVLAPVTEQIRATDIGPATGIAMKHLKGQPVQGRDVSEAVKRLKSGV